MTPEQKKEIEEAAAALKEADAVVDALEDEQEEFFERFRAARDKQSEAWRRFDAAVSALRGRSFRAI